MLSEDFHLGIFRSDYMLHAPKDGNADAKSVSVKQVEFNTIASALGPLAERTAALHRSVVCRTALSHLNLIFHIYQASIYLSAVL